MPIPALDTNGFLPEGIHDCTLDELAVVFAHSSRRELLFGNLVRYCAAWKATTLAVQIYVDGGFVTKKPEEPKDVDVVIDVSKLDLRDPLTIATIQPLFDQLGIRTRYELDVYAVHPVFPNDLRRFFTYVTPAKRAALGLPDHFRKGLLRLQI